MTLELTFHESKIVVESDDNTALTVMLSDGQTESKSTFDYVPMDMFDIIDAIKSCMSQRCYELVQGQRVRHIEYGSGTIICMSCNGNYGVEFDNYDGHNCGGVELVWGRKGTTGGCKWMHLSELTLMEMPKPNNDETFFVQFRSHMEQKEREMRK